MPRVGLEPTLDVFETASLPLEYRGEAETRRDRPVRTDLPKVDEITTV